MRKTNLVSTNPINQEEIQKYLKDIRKIKVMTPERERELAERMLSGFITEEETKEIQKELLERLGFLNNVGLDYLSLSRSAETLSGGEAQRVKLARELAKRATGRTLYVLDEPTVGLHMADGEKLIRVLHRLVDAGHSVVVIEHDLDVIAEADWVIDIGPEGGPEGGRVVAEGPPSDLAQCKESYTGQALQA